MKRIVVLIVLLSGTYSLLAQNLTVSNVVRTGLLATCNNSNPIITASWSSGSGTSVSNGTLLCSDPCGTTTLLVNITNLKWEQQNAEWIHSVFFPTNSGFTVSGISLPNGFITYNNGCTGTCPVGITAGPGFYFDATGGNSCCPGAVINDGNPCNNWGAATLNCSNPFAISFYLTFCNSILTTPTETFTLTAQSDGGTGCYDINNFTSHTVAFTINVSPCGPIVNPLASAPIRSCSSGSLNYTSTLTAVCNNGGTVTWWDAPSGGTQLGSGSPFVYDPVGSTCPGGQTVYATCCAGGSTSCVPRSAVTIPGTCTVPGITAVQTTIGTCATGAGITSVSTSNTVNPLTYTLNPGGVSNSTGVFPGLTQSQYTLTVSDAGSCTATSVVSLTQAPQTTFSTPNIYPVSCWGLSNGSLTVSASGINPITMSISPSATQSPAGTFTGLSAQTYTVSATDGNNCTATTTITIPQPTQIQLALTAPPIACQGGSTNITATSTGGTPGYQFSLNGGAFQTGNQFSVTAGTYTVTTMDANSCSTATTILISQPASVQCSALASSILCFGGNSTITVTATGGTSPYQYQLNSGNLQGGNSFTVLAGNYTITAIDANNCSSVTTISVSEPLAISLSLNALPIVCSGGSTTIIASASGGTPNYQFQLNNGVFQSSGSFLVTTGTYTVTAKDANNCSVTSSLTILEPTPVLVSLNTTSIACTGGQSTLTIAASGGTPGYQYQLNAGAYQNSNSFLVSAGTYTVTAKDANNCSQSTVVTITEPPALSVSVASGTILCQGGTTNITATGTGGTGAYQYQLNSGTFQSSNLFTVSAGMYTISIKDANNCTGSTTITITEPNLLTLSLSSGSILCFGGSTSISSTALGGTPSYQYSINGGSYQSGSGFTATAGSYTVTVKDANNCTASSVLAITQPTLLQITNLSNTIPTCVPGNDATLTITAGGGSPGYQYSLNNGPNQNTNVFTGLGPGTYSVTVTDVNGCSSVSSIQIITPNAP
ncbi:MAG: SprB repeat-containing protein, partial [Chitinophagaceae bacterium]|nr:SprB repeat-containing protein [Chitinophagaceae bacterium]